ncbi:MAG TPA: hypothetical protein VNM67_23235 [Thermoanaerobaculia bacterium]|jgi:hypothetical protein|nr:hypothetical protein [Thermoanaerobaculia bacterium]
MEDFVNDDEAPRGGISVEAILDELLPEELEWERLVRTYPVPAVALAAIGGFVIGLRHGPEILTAVSGFLAAEVSRNVSDLIG